MNRDYRDMLSALNDAEAEFLVVGAYALAAHGVPRATGDIDLWIRPEPKNARRVMHALSNFGAPVGSLTLEDLSSEGIVFQIGVAPRRIDILTSIDAVNFEEAWKDRQTIEVSGLLVSVISKRHLLTNKRATGRPRDLGDVAWLESIDKGS